MGKIPGLVIAALLGAALLGTGCQSSGGFSKRTQQDLTGVFRYPIVTNPTTLDPAKVEDGDTIDLLQQVYEGLVAWSPDNQPEPRLAENWKVSDDGTTYTFTLRKGVKFHNGKELTSEDVKWSIERACNPKIQSAVAATYMGDIVGLKEVVDGKATTITGIETPDPLTVTIRIDKPRPYWIGKFTFLTAAVMPKDAVPADREISKPEEMIGTGPFRVTEFVPEQVVKLEPFAEYHGGAPKLKRIERRVVKDAFTRLNLYRSGEIDLVMLERQDVAGLQKDPELKDHLKFFDRPAVWYVAMNELAYPEFKDRNLRRAIAMAIDRELIVNELLGGVNAVATGMIPPGVNGHREKTALIPFNPEEAKRLLAEAGYGPGKKVMPPLELVFREARPDVKIVAEAVASQIKQNLGFEPKLVTKEWRAMLEAQNRKELPFFHLRWAADYLDPENFVTFFFASYGPENKIGYKSAEVDKRTSMADVMPDGPERLKLYAEAEDIALADAAYVPIYFQRDAELINPRVKGLRESIFGHLPHTTVETE